MLPTMIKLDPFVMPVASEIGSLGLLEWSNEVRLLSSRTGPHPIRPHRHRTVIASTSLLEGEGSTAPLFEIGHLLPTAPEWDVALGPDGSCWIVYERAKGATYDLFLQGTNHEELCVTAGFPLDSHSGPRFIKRSLEPPRRAVTAITDADSVALFQETSEGAYSRTLLGQGSAARIVQSEGKRYLFFKTEVPGPARGTMTLPGRLHWATLGPDDRPLEMPIPLFADEDVYEFDVDVQGDVIVLFATTSMGSKLRRGRSPAGAFETMCLQEDDMGSSYTRPTVLLTPSAIHLAILDQAGTATAQILRGETSR